MFAQRAIGTRFSTARNVQTAKCSSSSVLFRNQPSLVMFTMNSAPSATDLLKRSATESS